MGTTLREQAANWIQAEEVLAGAPTTISPKSTRIWQESDIQGLVVDLAAKLPISTYQDPGSINPGHQHTVLVPYSGATGDVDLNNHSLINIAHLGVGQSIAPDILIRAIGDNGALSRIAMRGYSNDAGASEIRVTKFRGVYGTPLVPQSGDSLGKFQFCGYSGLSADGVVGAFIQAKTTELWTTTANGTQLLFKTTPNGAATPVLALTIDQDKTATFAGNVALGSNNLSMTGSLGATGARLTKGWFTDLEITNGLPASSGGTGIVLYTVGDLLCASGVTTLAPLHAVAVGQVLISAGAGVAPAWGQIDPTIHFQAYASGDVNLFAGGSNKNLKLAASGSGYVRIYGKTGIGTAPSYALDVSDAGTTVARIYGTGTLARLQLNSQTASPNVGISLCENGVSQWTISSYGGGTFSFYKDGVGSALGIAADRTTTFGAHVGIMITPAAVLHLAAGTATAGTAPLKLTSGVNLTTPEAGAMEFDGTNLFFTRVSARETVPTVLTKTNTGDPTGAEGLFCINTFDNNFKVYAEGAWRTLATW